MDDFRSQLQAVIDGMLQADAEPVFLVVDLEGAPEIKQTPGEESLRRFEQAAVETVVAAASGADAFTYGEDKIVVILSSREYDRLKTFALIQKLRRAIPMLGQSFDCYLRPEFDVLEYQPQAGVGGLITSITKTRGRANAA
jgi:hypothetical protein